MSQDRIALAAPATGPLISVSGASVVEGYSNSIRFTVTLSEAATDIVQIPFRALKGTIDDTDLDSAINDADFEGILTIPAGQTTGTINLGASSDGTDEYDEFVVLELHNPIGARLPEGSNVLRASGVLLDDDGAGSNLAVFVGDPVILEGDAGIREAVFEVRLSRPADQAVSFSYNTQDGSATAGSDYQAASGSLTFAPGQETLTVRVPVLGDTLSELNETFSLVVTPAAGVSVGLEGAAGEAVILDEDTGTGPVISISPSSLTEGEGYGSNVRFVVSLSEAPIDAVTVQYRLIGGTISDADLDDPVSNTRNTGTITFSPGQTSTVMSLPHINTDNDSQAESDESLVLELFNPSGAALPGGQLVLRSTGVVLDDDSVGSTLALFVGDPVIVEGNDGQREVLFELRLSQPAGQAFTVSYATADGSATAGADYLAVSGTALFSPGQEMAYVRVPVLGDLTVEASETFFLNVTPPTGVTLATAGLSGTATILEDDGGGQPVVTLSAATANDHYYPSLRFVATLSAPATDTVTLYYRTIAGTASDADLDDPASSSRNMGTITIAAGETSTEISLPRIGIAGDNLDERDENITLEIYNAQGAKLAGGGNVLRANGTILDLDGAGSNLALFVSDPVLVEGQSGQHEALFEVRLSQPASQAFTVSYATADASAVAGSDYVATSGSLTFALGQDVAYVRVPVIGDTVAEASEYFSLIVTPPDNIAMARAGATGTAFIQDDDASTERPVISIAQAEAVEGYSGDLRFAVTLSKPSTEAITVQVRTSLGTASADDLDSAVTSSYNNGTLTIPAGATTATFVIGGSSDNTDERDETIIVTLSDPVGAVLAGGVDSITAIGVFQDDDGAGLNIALIAPNLTIQETRDGEQPVELLLNLSRPSETALTFTVGIGQGTAGAQDYVLRDQQVTFAPGQTAAGISLAILGDRVAEGPETLTLTFTPAAGAAIAGTMPTSTVTILDYVPPSLSVTTSDLSRPEGQAGAATTYTYTITRTGNLTHESAVDWSVAGLGTNAANAADFAGGVLPSGRVSFAAGERTATVTVTVAGDGIGEGDEGFRLTLSNPAEATIGQATADAIIANDDQATRDPGTQMLLNGVVVNPTPTSGFGLEWALPGTEGSDIIVGTDRGDLLNAVGGSDAIDGAGGNDVIDGGPGSNFLTGGAGTDRFFIDGRGASGAPGGSTVWSTVTDFGRNGEEVTVWGWRDGVSRVLLTEAAGGAAGFQGATWHMDLDGDNTIDASVTLTGLPESAVTQHFGQSNGLGFIQLI